jgi:GWxTD domain-containing protein
MHRQYLDLKSLIRRKALLLIAGAPPIALAAQRPPGADTLPERAVVESLAVLRRINTDLKKNVNSAELWYRKGMIAWALFDRDRARDDLPYLDWTLLGREADTSLRIALALDPKNTRYKLTLGQYFLGTGLMSTRVQAYDQFHDVLAIARKGLDPALHAEAAIEYGRVFWRRYDAVANGVRESITSSEVRNRARTQYRDSTGVDATEAAAARDRPLTREELALVRAQMDAARKNGDAAFSGEPDYRLAERYIREGYEAMPLFERGFRQLAMLLAERSRWLELSDLARHQVEIAPSNGWAWMALGLATYRAGNTARARAAFERGLEGLPPRDRRRLDHIERVMLPSDTLVTLATDDVSRAVVQRAFWANVDPLWRRDDVDPRVEFLARITYAELRWTVEELQQRGADTDRGAVFIRYGPPDRIATTDDLTRWSYDFAHLEFAFRGAPTFGTTYFADVASAARVIDSIPALWDNLPRLRVDSIAVQAARFRAIGDSLDILFATRTPVKAIAAASDLASPVVGEFWLLDSHRTRIIADSGRIANDDVRVFRRRVGAGEFAYRFEATADGALVGARAAGAIGPTGDETPEFPTAGFGMSDLLLASALQPPVTPGGRWSDYTVAPLVGAIPAGSELSLMWEVYAPGVRPGSDASESAYGVAVTLRRDRADASSIAARIIGALSNAARRDASPDRVEFTFERTMPHRDAIVDDITLSLGETPAGAYEMTVVITDRVTGRRVLRRAHLVIAPQPAPSASQAP